ncbi:MAG: T9SS type A sorting domain-containing protein [Ferruginibacter sp.]|nr:T9SS type A sorting domain-containing protein [Ferruginibacter sp.]
MRKFIALLSLQVCVQIACFAQNKPASVTVYKKDTAFTCIAIDNKGNVYAGTNGKGLWKFDQSTWKNWNGFGLAFQRSYLRQIAIQDNDLWVASSGYVVYLGSGEAGNNINYWGGIHRIDPLVPIKRTYYRGKPILGQSAPGPPSRNVLGVCIDSTGRPWCAASYHDSMTYPAFLNYNSRYHFAPGAVGRFNGVNFSTITGAALPDPTGILIGTGNNYQSENYSIGKRRTCRSVVQAGNEIWVGSDGYDQSAGNVVTAGIIRYDLLGNYIGKYDQNNTSIPFGLTNGDFGPWSLCKDAKGRVWAGMSGTKGIAVYDSAGWHYIGVPSVLPSATIFRANSIACSLTGEVYFGTGSGLLVYKGSGSYSGDSSYVVYTTAQGLSSNSVLGVAVGKDKTIWACTSAGINKITTGDLAVYTLKPNSSTNPNTNDDGTRRLIAIYDSKNTQSAIDKDTLFIAADGSSATILKWSGSDSKNLEFRIKDGNTTNNPLQHGSFLVRYLDPNTNDSIRLQYTHPTAVDVTVSNQFNGKAVRLQVVDTTLNTEKIVLDIPVKIVLPPVLLLHGIWSDENTWKDMKAYLLNNSLYSYKPHEILTPSYARDREFTYNRAFIGSYIDELIQKCGNNHFSTGKVDVVCHSMGGILTRLYLQEGNGAGPYKKNINKLITINTPHSGSPLANIVENKDDFFRWILKRTGRDPYKGALNNLSIGKPAIDDLLNGPDLNNNIVPSHVIHSTDEFSQWAENVNGAVNTFIKSSIILKPNSYFNFLSNGQNFDELNDAAMGAKTLLYALKYYLTKNTTCAWNTPLNACLQQIYRGPNDMIVSDESQMGGMADAHTLFTGFNHLNVHTSPPIYAKVLSLLREKASSPQFSTNGFHPLKLRWDPSIGSVLARPVQNDSILIISPARGAFYNRGDSVVVTVRATGGIKRILFAMGYESDLDAFAVETPDSLFRFKVPANVASEVDLKVFGFDNTGNSYTDSSYILLNQGAGITLDSIRFARLYDNYIPRIILADSTTFGLFGFYSDGSIRNITFEPGISYVSGGGGISKSSPGYVKGLAIGFDELQAAYLSKADSLTVEVVPPVLSEPSYPLPVRFLSVTAQYNKTKVLVNWSTASEWNNSYFIVEYSSDGRNFSPIQRVEATNNAQGSQYQISHPDYISGKNYYRIKQVDIDGRSAYSAIVAVIISTKGDIKIYPNPVNSRLVIDAANLLPGKHSIRIVNTMGQVVFTQSFTTSGNKTIVDVNGWPAGIYWVEMTDAGHHRLITETFSKQ